MATSAFFVKNKEHLNLVLVLLTSKICQGKWNFWSRFLISLFSLVFHCVWDGYMIVTMGVITTAEVMCACLE